jgi:hypothetical protein
VLAAADTTGAPSAELIAALRAAFDETVAGDRWRLAGRAGAQAYSHIRRDVLHPLGPDGVRPYAELTGEAVMGPFALVSRPAAEPRLPHDPEWSGRRDLELAWRMVEAYASAQFKYGSVFYGQMDRNWGPGGIAGIGLSDYGYNTVEAGFEIGVEKVRLVALARTLNDAESAGQRIHRYFFAHRLGVRWRQRGERRAVGAWCSPARIGSSTPCNPLSLLLLANQYHSRGASSSGSTAVGASARHRPRGGCDRRPAVRT